jgi:hypothetical protein
LQEEKRAKTHSNRQRYLID